MSNPDIGCLIKDNLYQGILFFLLMKKSIFISKLDENQRINTLEVYSCVNRI